MNSYRSLSLEPWLLINPETWESKKIESVILIVKWDVWIFVSPSYNQQSIDLAREVTSNLWEQILCSILWWRKAKRRNNKWFDIHLSDWVKLEAKTGRIRNVTVIKNNQLEFMNKDCLFGFVFYRTTNNLPPSHFTSQSNWLNPEAYLKRNIKVESIFIYPHPEIVYFYNTCGLSEREIWKTWIKYKPLWVTNALKIFNENHWNHEQYESEKTYWKHKIKIYSLGYEVK
jgi:hypothetical protein